MGFFYFDESIHPRGKLSLGAFVYTEELPDSEVADALRRSGLTPYIDEFKSGARMDRFPEQAKARELLRSIVYERCGIGIVIAPHDPRAALGLEAQTGLNKILSTTRFRSLQHEVFFDRGIFPSSTARESVKASFSPAQPCSLHFEEDSVKILGLQLADLVAHSCSIMLLAELGLIQKIVKAGDNSGYDPDSDMELEFELWAGLRRNFFAEPAPHPDTWKSQLDWQVDVAARGLHIAKDCDAVVRDAALGRFGKMYLGCIH